jgi:hypothetical protein
MLRGALRYPTPVAVLLAACGHAPAPSTPHAVPASSHASAVGALCSMPERPLAAGVPARVFVEIASVEGDLSTLTASAAGAASFREVFADPSLAVRVAHVMTTNEAQSVVAWDSPLAPGGTPCDDSQRWDLAITPHIQDQQGRVVRLDIAFVPAPPLGTPIESWSVPEHRQLKTTVVLENQQLVVLSSPPMGNAKRPIVVLTPYVLRDDTDLRRLFECKMQKARPAARPAESH